MRTPVLSNLHIAVGTLLAAGCPFMSLIACAPSTPTQVRTRAAPADALTMIGESTETAMTLTIQSSAFENDAPIPKRFTGDGDDASPALNWSGASGDVKELALVMDDPDAPSGEPWVHWMIYKIPAGAAGLPEAVPTQKAIDDPAGALQGKNSWGNTGYGGPAPPRGHGVHHYHFKLYALDAALVVPAGLTKTQLLAAMQGHVLATGELVGTYER